MINSSAIVALVQAKLLGRKNMKRCKQVFVLFLSLCLFNLFMVGTAYCQENWYAKSQITKNKPVIKKLPEQKIPVEVVKGPQKEGGANKWILALLGLLAVGGVAAAAGGGGGGGGGGSDDDNSTGDVTISW